jgi:GNAT superfamily N-acetyltransferase
MAMFRVVTTYLEMRDPGELRAGRVPEGDVRVVRLGPAEAGVYRRLYRGVGRAYNWYSRYRWTDEEIVRNLETPGVEVGVMVVGGEVAGFFELKGHEEDRSVEVVYFGLMPAFVGTGLGGHLLTVALRTAWGRGPARVWLHTCSLDHPAAMGNYLARGMKAYKETVGEEPVLEVDEAGEAV